MDLTHRFAVPTDVETTWSVFQDIGAVAECFPGAQVTSSEGDTFQGTCKVKLGPIALVYSGSGSFVERDEAAHRFVVEAKGKDKRGNGTAGATVTVTMAAADGGTDVEVLTDLAITGKPAQFGRGVMQDVSDKLLGQFVACLEQRLGDQGATTDEPASGVEAEPATPAASGPGAAEAPRAADAGSGPAAAGGDRSDADAGALDLGSAVLPVLARSYGRQAAAGVVALLALVLLVRTLRR